MTNRKTTKRALFTSTLALLMCVAMLIGTTFAWFTDTATTSVNKVQAGTLDVTLEMWNGEGWVSAEGETLNFKAADNRAEILWEPGCTYELPALRVCNEGNLALKYSIQITGINGDAKLNEVIDWSIAAAGVPNTGYEEIPAGAARSVLPSAVSFEGNLLPNAQSAPFAISGKMLTTADNQYQGLSIDGVAVTVYATQDTVEYDSTTDQYDAAAPLTSYWSGAVGTVPAAVNGERHITSAAEFAAVMAATTTGHSSSLYVGETLVLDCDIDFGGATISGIGGHNDNVAFTFDGNGHTISNFVINAKDENHKEPQPDGSIEYRYAGLFQQFNGTVKNLTVRNATIIGDQMVGVIASNADSGGMIDNCKVYDSTVIGAKKVGVITGYTAGSTVKNCYAENCDVYASNSATDQSGEIVGYVNTGSTIGSGDTANTAVNVTVHRGSAASDVNVIADGVVLKGSTYEISSVAGLKWFNDQVNVSGNRFINETVKLTADINLAGVAWTPIGNDGDAIFTGTFDGNGMTISNLTVTDSRTAADDATAAQYDGVGFFGWLNGYVENVTFDNATVSGYHNVGVLAGYQQFGQIKNVTVKNSTVTGTHISENLCGDKIGGIVGVSYNTNWNAATNTNVDMTNCKIKNSTVKGGRDTGKIAGAAVELTGKFSDCTATSVTLDTTDGCTGANMGAYLDGFVGRDI